MKQAGTKLIVFFWCYQSLIAWGVCAAVLMMTFSQRHLPGDIWILVLGVGMFANLAIIGKHGGRYPLPGKLKAFVIFVLILSGLFAFFNFFAYLLTYPGGQPKIVDGCYALDYKGTVVRHLTEQEYHRLKCAEQRLFAGPLLFFYTGIMYLHLAGNRLKFKVWTPEKVKKGDM